MDLDPIFVDGSGRRRLVLRWSGIAAAGVLAAYLVIVGLTLISKVTVPQATLPGMKGSHAPERGHPREASHERPAGG